MWSRYGVSLIFLLSLWISLITWFGTAIRQVTLKEIIRMWNSIILVLIETWISEMNTDKVVKKLRFSRSIRVDPIGFLGGIWIL